MPERPPALPIATTLSPIFRFWLSPNSAALQFTFLQENDNYIYLPSKAYKLKSKNYFAFKIIYASLYLIVPLIMFLIMGFSSAFVISVLLFFVGYLLVSNLLMEVKL